MADAVSRGEFSEEPIRAGPPSASLGLPDGTMSIVTRYRDQNGAPVAVVHRYEQPDGSIAFSGKPDPTRLYFAFCDLTYET